MYELLCFPLSNSCYLRTFTHTGFLAQCLGMGLHDRAKEGKFLPFEFQNLKSWQKQYVWKKLDWKMVIDFFSSPKIKLEGETWQGQVRANMEKLGPCMGHRAEAWLPSLCPDLV